MMPLLVDANSVTVDSSLTQVNKGSDVSLEEMLTQPCFLQVLYAGNNLDDWLNLDRKIERLIDSLLSNSRILSHLDDCLLFIAQECFRTQSATTGGERLLSILYRVRLVLAALRWVY